MQGSLGSSTPHSVPTPTSFAFVATPNAVQESPLAALLTPWRLFLAAANRSPRTIDSYLETGRLFDAFLLERVGAIEVTEITRAYVEAFITDQVNRWKPKTAAI